MSPPSLYEIAGTLSGILAVWLTTRQNIWCWPAGIVNVSLYAIVFYRSKLYADMALQLVYVALCLYGWYHWKHPGAQRTRLPVSRLRPRTALALLVVGMPALAGLGGFLSRRTDASLPYLDSATTVASLLAQWLQTRKVLENWHVWIVTDLVYIAMYVYKDLFLTAGLYLVFTALAIVGLREWRKSLPA